MFKYNDCYQAYINGSKYSFDKLIHQIAHDTVSKHAQKISKTIIDSLFINCTYGLSYYDYIIEHPNNYILHPIWNGDSVDILNGYYMRKYRSKDEYIYYDGAPKLFDYLSQIIKKIDNRYKLEFFPDSNNNHIIRISL